MRPSARIPSLDGWRGISIILVIVGHEIKSGGSFGFSTQRNSLDFLCWQYYGVQVFFVISGFIITHLLLQEKNRTALIDFRGFYLRRFYRIIPALATYLGAVLLLSLFFYGENIGPVAWFKSFCFLGNFSFGGTPWSTLHMWSLSVEEQFYLFWPLVFLHKRWRLYAPLFFMVLCPICRIVDYRSPGHFGDFSFFTRADAIFIGSFFAIYRDHPWFTNFLRHSKLVAGLAAFCLIAGKLTLPHTGWLTIPFSSTFFSLAIVVLVNKSFSGSTLLFKVLNARFLVWLGGISYSLYLWQQLFYPVSILGYWLPTIFPFNFILAVLLAWMSSRFIEQPILAWRRRQYGTYPVVS